MAASTETQERLRSVTDQAYKYGFVTDIEADVAPKGLSEDIVRFISGKKNEPQWLLDWRLKAYRHWLTLTEPDWGKLHHPPIDYQAAYYYAAPKNTKKPKSLAEVDPELLRTYEKLGIPLREQEALAGVEPRIAVDAVFDSVSVATTFKKKLNDIGVIFCSLSEAIQNHPPRRCFQAVKTQNAQADAGSQIQRVVPRRPSPMERGKSMKHRHMNQVEPIACLAQHHKPARIQQPHRQNRSNGKRPDPPHKYRRENKSRLKIHACKPGSEASHCNSA